MPNSTEQSKAHELFFIDFSDQHVFLLAYDEGHWDKKLGESGYAVLQRFIDEGLIEPVPLTHAIERLFKKEQIITFLRDRGLKLSGKKEELVARLVEGDPVWAKEQSKAYHFYQRTAAGNEIAKTIAGKIGRESGELEARLLSLIYDGKYEEAYRKLASWDAEQVDPRGNERNVDYAWCAENSDDFVKMAQRVAAILPQGERARFLVDWLAGRVDLYEHSPMTQQHGKSYEHYLMDARRSRADVVGIRIISSPSCRCSFAKKYEGCYRLEDAPDHPFGPCDNEPCCLCWAACIFDDEQPEGGWKVPEKRHPLAGGKIEAQ
jgi:hypothetical protein